MEVADAAGIELAAQLGGDGGGDQLARGGQIVEPFEQVDRAMRESPRRTVSAKRRVVRDVRDRQDARHDLDVDARRRASSRKRKKQSAEKKNWVIARSAPASTLRFRLSRSDSRDDGVRDGISG